MTELHQANIKKELEAFAPSKQANLFMISQQINSCYMLIDKCIY